MVNYTTLLSLAGANLRKKLETGDKETAKTTRNESFSSMAHEAENTGVTIPEGRKLLAKAKDRKYKLVNVDS